MRFCMKGVDGGVGHHFFFQLWLHLSNMALGLNFSPLSEYACSQIHALLFLATNFHHFAGRQTYIFVGFNMENEHNWTQSMSVWCAVSTKAQPKKCYNGAAPGLTTQKLRSATWILAACWSCQGVYETSHGWKCGSSTTSCKSIKKKKKKNLI